MFLKKLIIGLLSFYTFDIKLRSDKNRAFFYYEIQCEKILENTKRREIRRQKSRLYKNPKWKKKKKFQLKCFKLQGTHAKDIRFSHQKKIRRMYRNA